MDEYESDTDFRTSIHVIPETPLSDSDQIDNGAIALDVCSHGAVALNVCPQVTHTVIFKCIGTTKESKYQKLLSKISKLRDRGVEVHVE